MTQVQMRNLDRIEYFVSGLKTRSKQEIILRNPETLEEAYQLAYRLDNLFQRTQSTWKPVNPSPPVSDPMDIGHVSGAPLKKLTNEEREALRNAGACFRCRKTGHIAIFY